MGAQIKRRKTRPIFDRLMAKVTYEPNSGCWLFTGAPCNPFGQCRLGFGARGATQVLVHRLSYEMHVGPIPDDLCVCHRCDVPCCVNPNHLFLGSHEDNMHDKERKRRGNQPKGQRHHKSKLTDGDVAAIRASADDSKTLSDLFGVGVRTINQVRSRQTWRHV